MEKADPLLPEKEARTSSHHFCIGVKEMGGGGSKILAGSKSLTFGNSFENENFPEEFQVAITSDVL